MNRTRVKICGLTRIQDVETAVDSGADAVGFVFVSESPRCLSFETAVNLCGPVPAFIARVGLFLNPDVELVRTALGRVPLNVLQFHGDEDPAFCRQFGLPYIKAIRMQCENPVAAAEREFADAAGILADSHEPGGQGGTGKQLDWQLVRPGRLPLILAGGLNAENVASAIAAVKPWAVDVSSGVETEPGIKSGREIERFIKEAKSEYGS